MSPPDDQWIALVFSDETRFNFSHNDGRVRMTRGESLPLRVSLSTTEKQHPTRHGVGGKSVCVCVGGGGGDTLCARVVFGGFCGNLSPLSDFVSFPRSFDAEKVDIKL